MMCLTESCRWQSVHGLWKLALTFHCLLKQNSSCCQSCFALTRLAVPWAVQIFLFYISYNHRHSGIPMILYLLLCDIKLLLALLEALNIDDLRSPSHTFCFQYILKYYLYQIVAYYMDSSIILKIVKNHILIKQLIAKKKVWSYRKC